MLPVYSPTLSNRSPLGLNAERISTTGLLIQKNTKESTMSPLNNLMNRVDGWSQSLNPETDEPQGFFKRVVAGRLATVVFGVPLEVAAAAQNVFKTFYKGVFMPLKVVANTISCVSGTDALDVLDEKLPKYKSFFKAVYRVAAYAIGTFFTLTVGFISPAANFKLHAVLGLGVNERERDQQAAAALIDIENAKKAEAVLKEAAAKLQAELTQKAEQEKAAAAAAKRAVQEKLAVEATKKAEQEKAAAEAAKKAELEKVIAKKAEAAKIAVEAGKKADQEKAAAAAQAAKKAEQEKAAAAAKIENTRNVAASEVDSIEAEINDILKVEHKPSTWYKPWTWLRTA